MSRGRCVSELLEGNEAGAGVSHGVESDNLHGAVPSRVLGLSPVPNPMGGRSWSSPSIRASSKAGRRRAGRVVLCENYVLSTLVRLGGGRFS